MVRKGNAVVC